MRWDTAQGEAAYRNVSRKAFAIILGVMIALGFCLLTGAPARAHADGEGFVAGEPQRDGNVARIGDQGYATLKEAIDNAHDGDTIEMIADSPDEPAFNFDGESRNITLDLKGKTVTENGDPTVKVGTLTIEDSSENADGTLVCYQVPKDPAADPDDLTPDDLTWGGITVDGSGLVIKSGRVSMDYGFLIINGASATIDGGSVEARQRDAIGVQGSTLTVNDGTLSGRESGINASDSSQVFVNGGEIGGNWGIQSDATSPVEIKGGTISGSTNGIFAGGSFTITGGAISGTGKDAYGVYVTLYGDVEISDGQIKGAADKSIGFHTDLSGQPQGTINISGGMFSDKAGENCLVEGYVYFNNTDPQTMSDYPFVVDKPKYIAIPKGLTLTWNGHDQCGVDSGTGYTLTDRIQKEVGNYTSTAKLLSGYKWNDQTTEDKVIHWSIVPAPIAGAKVTLATTSYTCNGKAKAPKVKAVSLNGKTLIAGTDYTVSYKNNVNPGTATAIVTGKGNYKGTAKATFTIKLAKAKVRTAAYPSKKKIVASWSAVKGAKSYQLQWRVKGGKWKTVSVKTTKKAVTKLKVGKAYSFRVRAVAGKVKGPWSAVITRTLK